MRYEVHFWLSDFQISYPLNINFGPAVIAPAGHSRAHLLHDSQKACMPKSIGLSCIIGISVVTTPDFSRGPRKGLTITSPILLTSPRPDKRARGGCKTSPSKLECTRAEKPKFLICFATTPPNSEHLR